MALNQHVQLDSIQLDLDAVTRRLVRPGFLSTLSPSRLPSQAASDSSLSPTRDEARLHAAGNPSHHRQSQLSFAVTFEDALEHADLVSPLIQEPCADGSAPSVDERIAEYLELRFLDVHHAYAKMAAERSFQPFSHGHQDLVLAVDFNYFGTRMVTASSDHRIKVWDKKDDVWTLVESWKAHDAEIVDVKWNGPFMGEVIGSIGEDGRCKLWQEDATAVPMSGSRFQLITNLASQTHAPFMSLDFKNIMQETWLALITRDGLLTVLEPQDQSSLNEWTPIAERWVSGDDPPQRQDEVGFKVVFHKEKLPCWTAIMAGLDRKSLSLAVAAMKDVLVFRTDKAKRFFQVAKLEGARQIIRDLAWANGSMRGYDILATASKDGAIRIYELSTPDPEKGAAASSSKANESVASPRPGPQKNAPSGIGAGLAGASRAPDIAIENEQNPGRIVQRARLTDTLTDHHGAVWRVTFSQMGDLLVSTGDDASIRTWKKAVNGRWTEYAEIESGLD
ncbi:WD40 repeat-like protein [Dothidotthia symphoricarpi CBS 119687]|uniref:WD40 repeat-like protein n=1 Tax=Dothidotthia symphoricarpi CBS 119687 TaxID=1392245 RepID=A0A6A6A3I1_9PLEO|nr:WD40 repeat-like protein [Dothidotthia symphoricarpi CBS 119687]KAF2125141.1 WD40 repeat-like protein [Dothidotthia symphoricarpi CBS 119687]